jgi:hypothetical protein
MMEEYLDKYYNEFGEAFPTMPLMWGRTEKEVIQIIKRCLSEHKDVYALGYVKDDNEIMY